MELSIGFIKRGRLLKAAEELIKHGFNFMLNLAISSLINLSYCYEYSACF